MLTPDELTSLEALLDRAKRADSQARGAALAEITPGDVVQLRPGIDRTWESSLILVKAVSNYQLRGELLRPHRGGCMEAWYRFKPGEVLRVGRAPFPDPAPTIKAWTYEPPCEMMHRKPPAVEGAKPATAREALTVYRDHREALQAQQKAETLRVAEMETELRSEQKRLRQVRRSHGRRLRKEP